MKKWEVGYTSSGEFHIKPRPETPLARSNYARLIETACNAAREINPENPIAAAEAMPEIFRLLLAAVVDAQKICGKGRLDPEEWLKRAHAAIDKAMKEAT